MNIKKDTLKTLCAVLACSTFLCSLLPVYATEIISESQMDESDWTADEKSLEEIEVTYRQASIYNVIIPKTITLDKSKQAAYSVKVTGDIDANERVHVVPVDGISSSESIDFYMKDQTPNSKKGDVVASVMQKKVYWSSEDVANGYEEKNNSVSAPDLTAGTWKGTFQVAINLETMAEHKHNFVDGVCTGCGEKDPNAEHEHKYVDGKCDCGAIDPDHTHNFEDGTCTICGKETDPYEVAPANEYSDWDYTLDDENNIITLNYYKGSKTDVIVYARYDIDGKTYKTQLASNTTGTGDINSDINNPYMFNGCLDLRSVGIKTITFNDGIDTSKVTDMSFMFNGCSALTSINFGESFDTSNVTNMALMFSHCTKLTFLDLSNFDTSKVTDMSCMFHYDELFTNIDLSSFDTSNVTNMTTMFAGCTLLRNINLSSFNTSNVTDMAAMFNGCSALTNLDLSSFNTSNVTNMDWMFMNCTSLKKIYVTSDMWSTSQATRNSMYSGCTASITLK